LIVGMAIHPTEVGTQIAVHSIAFVVTIVTVLLLGGTAIFIDCQRAIVLGLAPALGHALKLRPGETRVLRAACVYWLIVHLVPTVIVHANYLAEPLQLDWFPRFSMPASFTFYWAWALATAPFVVMSLPIVLFESPPDPLTQGRLRLQGNAFRMF